MKKFFTLLAVSSLAVSVNAQTYFTDDFEGGSLTGNNAWTIQTPIGSGTYDWYYDNFSGDNFAEASAFSGSPQDAESWLITPAMDLSAATQAVLTFQSTANFSGLDLEVYISTVYGGGAINMGDWTQVTGFNLSTASNYDEVASGDVDLTSYSPNATTYLAWRFQSNPTDGSRTWQLDDILVKEGPTVTPTLTIYDIQYTLNDPADSPEEGNTVTTSGVVTSPSQDASGDGYFIQDADGSWNGLCINDVTNTPSIGDSVEVTGIIEENFGFTRMVSLTNFVNHGPSSWTPTEVTIDAADASSLEEYESVLVEVVDVECTNDNIGNGLWEGHDGTDTLVVDDDCFNNDGVLGNWYDIVGVMTYSFSQHKINPRTGADLTIIEYATVEESTNEINIYPNPATDNVVINAAPDAIVNIYSMTGALVANGVANTTMNVSDLESGIYHVVISSNGKETARKLVIK